MTAVASYFRHWHRHLVMLPIMIMVLTWLFQQAGSVSPGTHYQYLEVLRALHQADVETNTELLASRAELAHNYDKLTGLVRETRTLLAQAEQPPAFLQSDARLALSNEHRSLRQLLTAKADLIDRYQRSDAVLHNSVNYLPQAIETFFADIPPARQSSYQQLFRDMLTFSHRPTPEIGTRIRNRLKALDDMPHTGAEGHALEKLLPHLHLILEQQPEVDMLVKSIINQPTQAQVDALSRVYTDGHQASQQIANRYRLALYGLAVVLVLYVAYTYARLDKNQQALAQANTELHDRFQAQQRTEAELSLYATVFTSANEGMMMTDRAGTITAVNPAFTKITGFLPEEVRGQTPVVLRSGMHDSGFYRLMWEQLDAIGAWAGEIWNRRKDGTLYPSWLSITAVRGPDNTISHYIGIFTDISERKEIESRIHHLAYHDALTGLPNRLVLEDRLEQAVLKAHRSNSIVAVLFIDLDRFKNINDTLGHNIGDLLLVEAARRGTTTLRETDTLSRQGGDEFVVILPDLDNAQDASQVANKLLQALARPYQLAGHELTITGSIGIAIYPDDGNTVSDLLRNADTAMYRAKEEGRNLARFYSPDMNYASLGNLLLESHLRTTLDRGELLLHYQPKFDARSGKLIGAEALMRWQHPEQGMIPPSVFIPLAEECGLIGALGEWALNAVCRQQRQWLDAGLAAVPVAVNVSAQQFGQHDIPELVTASLSENNLPPALLDLEVTESLLMHDTAHTISVLSQLRDMGITLAIDDFGTGYSSLGYLKDFPVQILKIDRSFVQDIDESTEEIKLAGAIIALAHSLKMHVIAEGVETEAQQDFLIRHNCDEFQGYLFAKPMPPEDFAHLLDHPAA